MIRAANRIENIQEYYFSVKLKEIAFLNKAPEKVINLGIGDPDLSPSQETWKSLREACQHPGSHGYQNYRGIPALREAFANWYKNHFRVSLDPEQEILPLMGSKEGIMLVSLAYLNPGDKVLIPDPAYPVYQSVTQLLGGETIKYPLTEKHNWQPDLKALEKQDLTGVKIMWVNYPHMPTGAGASKMLFQQLVNFGRKHRILIVNDNPYSFILNGQLLSIMEVKEAKECSLELNSLSKSHNMPGCRVGMVCGSQDLLKPVFAIKTNMDSGMFYPLQQAAIKALNIGNEWYRSINKTYQYRRHIVFEILNHLGCSFRPNQCGIFVWARIPDSEENGHAFSDRILKQYRIFITPGGIFGDQGKKYVRVSLCNSDQMLEEALKRVKNKF